MANQVVSIDRNFDDPAIAGLVNGDDLTINSGAKLTINSDTRGSFQNAVIGNITIDANTGGEVHIDSRYVRMLQFSGSSIMPVAGRVCSGVYSSQVCEVINVYGSMVSGTVKLRSVPNTYLSGEPLIFSSGNGIGTAVAVNNDVKGWLEIIGEEQQTITVGRLGTLRITGDWIELGVTDGSHGQRMFHFTRDIIPAAQVELYSGAGIYQWWTNAGQRWRQPLMLSNDERCLMFSCISGVLEFASGTVGMMPPINCRVRVPNLHIGSTVSTNWNYYTESTTLANRWETATTAAATVLIDKMTGGGFYCNISQANTFEIRDSALFDYLPVSEVTNTVIVDNCAVNYSRQYDTQAFYASNCYGGVQICSGVYGRYNFGSAGNYVLATGICKDVRIVGTKMFAFNRGNAGTYTLYPTGSTNVYISGTLCMGGEVYIATCKNVVAKGMIVQNLLSGNASNVQAQDCVVIGSYCDNVLIDGLSYFRQDGVFRSALVNISTSNNIVVQNIGTRTNPLLTRSMQLYLVTTGGGSTNCKIMRCYTSGIASYVYFNTNNADTGFEFQDVYNFGPPIDTAISNTVLNSVLKHVGGGKAGTFGTGSGQIAIAYTSVYGFHFYEGIDSGVCNAGKIGIVFNEKTTASPSSTAYTIDNGTPAFDSTGKLHFINSGDTITYTWPHYIKGYKQFFNNNPTTNGINKNGIDIKYRIDPGTGVYGDWKSCTGANLNSEIISGGFKPQFRFSAGAPKDFGRYLDAFYLPVATDPLFLDQNQYPLITTYPTFLLTGLQTGSEIRVYDSSTGNEITGIESTDGSTFSYTYTWDSTIGDRTVDIIIFALGYLPVRYLGQVLGQNGLTIPVQQTIDRVYSNPAGP